MKKKTNKKNNSMQVILIWCSTSRKWKWNLCFVHENIVDPFWTFLWHFYQKEDWSTSPSLATLLPQPRSYEYRKKKYICFVFFFRHFGSATQTCACFKCGKITATKAPAPGRKRFVSVDCGRISSSSSSWRDQPAQTWCHSESAHVLHPGLTRRNQLGSGSDVLSWNHFSPNDRNEYRSYDECV